MTTKRTNFRILQKLDEDMIFNSLFLSNTDTVHIDVIHKIQP